MLMQAEGESRAPWPAGSSTATGTGRSRQSANGQTIRDHVEREIIPREAATIRRIFEEIAQGRGFARASRRVDSGRRPLPAFTPGLGAERCARDGVRDLYRRPNRLGKTKWVDRGGTKVKQDRPESEWLSIDAPHLRIIPEELWQVGPRPAESDPCDVPPAHQRKLWGRPRRASSSKYLLSGLLVCGTCGGAMHATKRTSLRGAPAFYYVLPDPPGPR